jgi:predicted N-acetyltransferase YhbS
MFEYVYDFKNDNLLRDSFNNLACTTFNIDFENWYKKGFWNDNYVCHSMAHNGQIISNVSISKMHLIIEGEEFSAIQIGTVMTHPDYRMNGLARNLMGKVIDTYAKEYQILYLFPNAFVINFYPKFGFELTRDCKYSIDITIERQASEKVVKLDVNNDTDLHKIIKIVSVRSPRSLEFDCINSISIFMWYCLNVFKNMIFILEPENVIVIYEENENKIDIYDIVTSRPLALSMVLNRITDRKRATVTLHFTPDFEDIKSDSFEVCWNEDLYARPMHFLSGKRFAHPIMAHT